MGKSAMTFMDLDFKSIDLRKQFLTDYLLSDDERNVLIAEIQEEQKRAGLEGDDDAVSEDGLVETNQTQIQNQITATPQIQESSQNNAVTTSVSYDYLTFEEDERKEMEKNKMKDELRKKRSDLESNESEMELVKMGTVDVTTGSTVV